MLATLGGAVGLYTGFCWVTIFELLELLILMAFAALGFGILAEDRQEDVSSSVQRQQGSGQAAWKEENRRKESGYE
jgi:hypothetical protein